MIKLENVTKRFGKKVAVNNLSLEILPGELFACLGPNGAGKTTTIKMIVGLLQPTSGSVKVGKYDLSRQSLEAKNILGYVPDEPFLYEKLSGYEFLHFMAKMYNVDGVIGAKEIDRWVELFSMKEYIHELIESYSHGMKQRVVLSATFLHQPKVIVVDEPLVGLDPQTTCLVKDLFRKATKEGATVFMSTHLVSLAEQTADRIGILFDGRLVALGTCDELRKESGIHGSLEEIFLHYADRGAHNVVKGNPQ